MSAKTRITEDQIARAKAVDMLALAGRYTELNKIARAEYAGPCPRCGGEDRFHVHETGWWFCRQCHEKRGDAIDFVQWMGLARTFPEAVAWLTGDGLATVAPVAKRKPTRKRKQPAWKVKAWQAEAWRELNRAHAVMDDTGLGLDYLASRGITPETARGWLLGALPDALGRGPALVMPWLARDLRITALQYRFIEAQVKRHRFAQKAGGERIIFGATQRSARPGKTLGLILVEGELNALSIAQALDAAGLGLDVLSYGPQDNATRPELAAIAGQYPRVLIWADEAGKALAASKALPHAVPLKSPNGLDANDLLQAGKLAPFLATVLARLGWAPGL